jgi:hypothetical protein
MLGDGVPTWAAADIKAIEFLYAHGGIHQARTL